jgi:hypothetical protein
MGGVGACSDDAEGVTAGETAGGDEGAAGGGGISGTRSSFDGCSAEPFAVFPLVNNPLRYSPHSAPWTSIVAGGAGPHDLRAGAPHGSTNVGASAAARRRQKGWCSCASGSGASRRVLARKMLIQHGSSAK